MDLSEAMAHSTLISPVNDGTPVLFNVIDSKANWLKPIHVAKPFSVTDGVTYVFPHDGIL